MLDFFFLGGGASAPPAPPPPPPGSAALAKEAFINMNSNIQNSACSAEKNRAADWLSVCKDVFPTQNGGFNQMIILTLISEVKGEVSPNSNVDGE